MSHGDKCLSINYYYKAYTSNGYCNKKLRRASRFAARLSRFVAQLAGTLVSQRHIRAIWTGPSVQGLKLYH